MKNKLEFSAEKITPGKTHHKIEYGYVEIEASSGRLLITIAKCREKFYGSIGLEENIETALKKWKSIFHVTDVDLHIIKNVIESEFNLIQ